MLLPSWTLNSQHWQPARAVSSDGKRAIWIPWPDPSPCWFYWSINKLDQLRHWTVFFPVFLYYSLIRIIKSEREHSQTSSSAVLQFNFNILLQHKLAMCVQAGGYCCFGTCRVKTLLGEWDAAASGNVCATTWQRSHGTSKWLQALITILWWWFGQ